MDKNRLSLFIRIISSIAAISLGFIFIYICLSIYMTGNNPSNLDSNGVHINQVFSVESIKKGFAPFIELIVILFCLLVGCTIYSLFLGKEHTKFTMSPENKLRLMKSRVSSIPVEAKKEEKRRLYINLAAATIVVVSVIFALIYLLNKNNFTSWDLEGVMMELIFKLTPPILLSFVALIARAILIDRSLQAEIEIIKGVEKTNRIENCSIYKEKPKKTIVVFIYVIAFILIIAGIANGGMNDVFIKAINICTECIGLG